MGGINFESHEYLESDELKDLKALSAKISGDKGKKSDASETASRIFADTKSTLQREIKKKEAELERLKHVRNFLIS